MTYYTDDPDVEPDDSGEDLPQARATTIDWRRLGADEAEHEWLALNAWVDWLRKEFGLSAQVIPPAWHRHPELVWELSALHQHWLNAYDAEQHASAPIGWLADFHAARHRLREWVAASGTRLDRDRPTRMTSWPGEDSADPPEDVPIRHRDRDFIAFILADVQRRREDDEPFTGTGE
ncbi:hypothetical protein [Jiangella anatolica]|uniref:DUF4913 domain-containing protein n=1 Tax=Jiangella anatolica TaxID=2670374 RepID=A0A2W2B2Z1_9ACTN|nr:hypothetical protein [Jiangella anatolica]PZF80382.1 hypothetical protein C1I92_26450 [Jiangella anatolica]